ncbi:MAG: signal peptidase I [Chloroflexota bacterium]
MHLSIALPALAGLALVVLGPAHVVVSTSMSPTFRPGDVVWLRSVGGDILPGMVITYSRDDKLIVHRVVAVEGETLITQGDSNPNPDPRPVPRSSVVGIPVLRVPYLGLVLGRVRSPVGWALFVVLPALLIVFLGLWIIVLEARRAGRRPHGSSIRTVRREGFTAWRAEVLYPAPGGFRPLWPLQRARGR